MKLVTFRSVILILTLSNVINLFSFNYVFAQAPDYHGTQANSSVSYLEMIDSVTSYFDSIPMDSSENSDLANFERWQEYWNAKVNYDPTEDAYLSSIEAASIFANGGICETCTTNYCKTWEPIGHQTTQSSGGSPARGQGRLIAIEVDIIHDPTGNTIYAGSPYGGLWKTTNALSSNPTWNCITNSVKLPGMGVNYIAIDPNDSKTVYISTGIDEGDAIRYGMGILKTTEADQTNPSWSNVTDDVSFSNSSGSAFTQGVYFFPNSSSDILVLKRDEIWISNNAGTSFTKKYDVSGSGTGNRFFRDVVFLPANGDIFVSCDDIFADEGGAFVIHSSDGGDTWSNPLSLGFSSAADIQRIDIAVTPADDDLIIAYCDQGISKSLNGGSVWSQFNPNYSCDRCTPDPKYQDIVISPDNPLIMYTGAVTAAKSINGGVDFDGLFNSKDLVVPHVDIRKIFVYSDANDDDVVVFADDGGVDMYHYDNSQNDWIFTKLNGTGLHISTIYDFDINKVNGNLITGCLDVGFYRLESESNEWENLDYFADGVQVLHDLSRKGIERYSVPEVHSTEWQLDISNNSIWHLRSNLFHSLVGVDNMDNIPHLNPTRLGTWFSELGIDGQGNIYIAERYGQKLYRTDYDDHTMRIGTTAQNRYREIGNFPNSQNRIHGLGLAKSTSDTLYVGFDRSWVDPSSNGNFNKVLWRTDNANDANPTWLDLTSNLKPSQWIGITDIVVDPYNSKKMWVCMGIGRISSSLTKSNRIQFSLDGGQTFEFLTEGLYMPDGSPYTLPIYCMVMDEGTGGLYIGTQFGVMYNPNPTDKNSSWVCFNDGLPSSEVKELKIDYCSRKIIAGTFGRGLWAAPLAESSSETTEITSDVLLNVEQSTTIEEENYQANEEKSRPPIGWAWYPEHTEYVKSEIMPTRVYNRSIVIPSGKKMTIKGRVLMAPGTSIKIEAGAELAIDGGVLTSICSQWDGIIVEGDLTKAQTQLNQGMVRITNGGSVSHAKNAVTLAGYNTNGTINWNKTGGIIQANDAKFVNNTRDVAFLSYNYRPVGVVRNANNISYFKDVEFVTNDDYRGNNDKSSTHVTLWQVTWVKFTGCNFHDERSIDKQYRMDGIKSLGSTYRIGCNGFNPLSSCNGTVTTFENLRYGIRTFDGIYAADPQMSSSIQNCKFVDNLGAIHHSGVQNATLTNNDLDLNGYGGQLSYRDLEAFGMYLDGCDGYHLEGNNFNSNFGAQGMSGDHAVGMIIRQNESKDNDVYRNFFDDFYIGTETVGWNRDERGAPFLTGLKLRCNEYANPNTSGGFDNFVDVLTVKDLSITLGDDQQGLPQQGSQNNPAMNLFGNYGPVGLWNFDNVTPNQINYFHNDPTIEPRVEPEYFSSVINNDTKQIYVNSQCPDQSTNGITIGSSEIADIEILQDSKQAKQSQWSLLTDGGDTDGLVDDIRNATSINISAILSDLTQHSPYLSNEVLAVLAESTLPFTHGNIRDILVLNNHAGRSNSIIDILENRNDTFPVSFINQIDSAADSISARDSLLFDIYNYSGAYSRAVNSVLCRAKLDSVDRFTEIVEPLLEISDEPRYKYLLASIYEDRGDPTSATTVLNGIPSQFELTSTQDEFHTDFMNLRNTLQTWKSLGVQLAELDSSKLLFLKSYASKTNGVERLVRPLLELNDSSNYLPPIYEVPTSSSVPPPFISSEQETDVKTVDLFTSDEGDTDEKPLSIDGKLLLYPNPANRSVSVAYNIENRFTNATLAFINSSGVVLEIVELKKRKGQYELNLTNYPEGQYFCKLQIDDQTYSVSSYTVKH